MVGPKPFAASKSKHLVVASLLFHHIPTPQEKWNWTIQNSTKLGENSGPQVRTEPRGARGSSLKSRGTRFFNDNITTRATCLLPAWSGTSHSWEAYRRNVAGIFARFRDGNRLAVGILVGVTRGATHTLISEEDATSRALWETFATWLFEGYTIPPGKRGAGEGVAI